MVVFLCFSPYVKQSCILDKKRETMSSLLNYVRSLSNISVLPQILWLENLVHWGKIDLCAT
jgi:hypothetical protein